MKITKDDEFKKWIINEIVQREFNVRAGVHCSDLIYCLNKQALRRVMPLPSTEHEVLTFSLGWASQRWLTGKLKDEDTIEVDGIQVTPDCLWDCRPWELKATFTSSERDISENDSWLKQIMAQCYVTKTLEARLTRLELMGNWKSIFGKREEKGKPENQKPTLSAFKLEFSQDELDSNWLWLRARKSLFDALLKDTAPLLHKGLALPEKHEWECDYCPEVYKDKCGSLTSWMKGE